MKKMLSGHHGRLFYTMVGLLSIFIIIPIIASLIISLQIVKVSEAQMRSSISIALQTQVKYMQAVSPARQRSTLLEFFRGLSLERMADSEKIPRGQELEQLENALRESTLLTKTTTGLKKNYIYFVKSDYLVGTADPIDGVVGYEEVFFRKAWDNVNRSDPDYSASQYFFNPDENLYYTVSVSCLSKYIYLVSEHIYNEQEGPTDSLSSDFLNSFEELEFAYYDCYGGYHTATGKNTLTELYTYDSLGEADNGSFSFTYNHHSYLATYVSLYDNQTRMALFCRDSVSESRHTTTVLLLVSAAFFVLTCGFMAAILLYRSYSPLGNLVSQISPDDGEFHDDAAIIEHALHSKDFILKEQSNLLEQCYYLRLLRGLDTEMIESYRNPWIDEKNVQFLIVAIRLEAYGEDLILQEDDIKRKISSFMASENYDSVSIPSGEFYFLIIKTHDFGITPMMVLDSMNTLQSTWNTCSFSAYISNLVNNSQDINSAYWQAMATAEYCAELEQYGRTFCYCDMPTALKKDDAVSIVYMHLKEYSEAISKMEIDTALSLFDIVMNEAPNKTGNNLSISEPIFSVLMSTTALAFYRIAIPDDADKKHIQQHMKSAYQAKNFKELRSVLSDTLEEFTFVVNNADVNNHTFLKIEEFVLCNLSNPNLSASLVAEQFKMSSANITRLFKKYNHTGFLEYMHNLRVNQACKLLKETEMTLPEIAEKVGYNNTLTMTRAFKNYANTTPGMYRRVFKVMN